MIIVRIGLGLSLNRIETEGPVLSTLLIAPGVATARSTVAQATTTHVESYTMHTVKVKVAQETFQSEEINDVGGVAV
jgi:hypothetical protein